MKHYYSENGLTNYVIPDTLMQNIYNAYVADKIISNQKWYEVYNTICGIIMSWNVHKEMEPILGTFTDWLNTTENPFEQAIKMVMADFAKDYLWKEFTLIAIDISCTLGFEFLLREYN
jgi:hypothetical protein